MTAFNFTVNVEKVKDGRKLSTIRKEQRCKVGERMWLYERLDRVDYKILRIVECVGTAKVEITEECPWFLSLVNGDVNPAGKPLHEQEGFQNVAEFIVSKKDARHIGLKRYYTGKPTIRGYVLIFIAIMFMVTSCVSLKLSRPWMKLC